MVTKMGSSSRGAVEGCALLQGREVPPPTRRESTNHSEKEESLSKASWCVPSEEELQLE